MKIRLHSEWIRKNESLTWNQYEAILSKLDVAHACRIRNEDSEKQLFIDLYDKEGQLISTLVLSTAQLPSAEIFEQEIRRKASYPYGNNQRILQYVYNHLYNHNEWPNTKRLRVDLKKEKLGDLYELGDVIGRQWIRIGRGESPDDEVTRLTFSGASLCNGSEVDVRVFLRLVRFVSQKYCENPEDPSNIDIQEMFKVSKIEPDQITRFLLLIRVESGLFSGSIWAPEGYLKSCKPSEFALELSEVKSIDDYHRVLYNAEIRYQQQNFPVASPSLPSHSSPLPIIPEDILSTILTDTDLLEKCRPQFEAGHFPEAVQTALSVFEQRIRKFRVKNPRSGKLNNICAQLFSAKTGKAYFPFCVESDDPEQTGHQQGMLFLYQGAAALRNMTHHQGIPATKTDALNLLGFVNYLLETAKRSRKGSLEARLKKIKRKS